MRGSGETELSAWNVGVFPGRDSEVRGKWVLPRGEIVCARKTVVIRSSLEPNALAVQKLRPPS